jgi:hypothetical protein
VEPQHHPADATIRYEWFTYVPTTMRSGAVADIWVGGLHGNIVSDNYEAIVAETVDLNARFALAALAEEQRLCLLVPVLPRPFTPDRQSSFYTVSLSRAVFLTSTPAFCRRPDLVLNQMLDRFAVGLRAQGYHVADTVFIDGFSAGAMFAQRYALLHPKRVRAVCAGQCGGALTLPEAHYGDVPLDWPLGVHDLPALTGIDFEREAYRRIPQLVYISADDTDNSTLVEPGEVWHEQAQIDMLNQAFGTTDPLRLERQVAHLQQQGFPHIAFHTRVGVGHTERPFLHDIMAFFNAHRV